MRGAGFEEAEMGGGVAIGQAVTRAERVPFCIGWTSVHVVNIGLREAAELAVLCPSNMGNISHCGSIYLGRDRRLLLNERRYDGWVKRTLASSSCRYPPASENDWGSCFSGWHKSR